MKISCINHVLSARNGVQYFIVRFFKKRHEEHQKLKIQFAVFVQMN